MSMEEDCGSKEDVLIKRENKGSYSGNHQEIEAGSTKSGSNGGGNGMHHNRQISIDTFNLTPQALSKINSPVN